MNRAVFLLIGLLCTAPTWATNRWFGNNSTGTGDGTSAANVAALVNTANVLSKFGGAIARGDNMYICGDITGAQVWSPGGVGSGAGTGYFTLNGTPGDSGCPRGAWRNATGVPIAFAGGSRDFIKIKGIGLYGCDSHCMTVGGNDNVIEDIDCDGAVNSCIRGTSALQRLTITRGTYKNFGSAADAAINLNPSNGVTMATVTIDSPVITGNGLVRYGLNAYPPGTGIITGLTIANPVFLGSFTHAALNITNKVPAAVISRFDSTDIVNAGAAAIHIGGQADIATGCTTTGTTDDVIVRDSIKVRGGRVTAGNPSDGAGIFYDECASGGQILRNKLADNAVADMYFNDAVNVTVRDNEMASSGDNAVHLHGLSSGNLFEFNTAYCNTTASGVADQGLDCFQVDATALSNTVRYNIVEGNGSTAKCLDADAAITEADNVLFGCLNPFEGGTQTRGSLNDPLLRYVPPSPVPNLNIGPGSSARGLAKCTLAVGCVPADIRGYRGRVPPNAGAYQR